MPHYKLLYFPIRGLAESIRLLLKDQGIEFEEQNVDGDTWPELKPNMRFGQIPCFVVDGNFELVQSQAIMRYLAREHDLYGETAREKAMIDMITDGLEDVRKKYADMIYRNYEDGKAPYIKTLPTLLAPFEKCLSANDGGKGFVVGNKISFVDYNLFTVLDMHEVLAPGILDQLPTLKSFYQRMMERPNTAKYRNSEEFKTRRINGNGKQ